MSRQKRKLTTAEKRAKAERRAQFVTIFVHGKQKRVRRPPAVEGIPVDEFILRNAVSIWLHQNEMWEYIDADVDPDSDTRDEFDASVEASRPLTMPRAASC
jgi:hypothetical protein